MRALAFETDPLRAPAAARTAGALFDRHHRRIRGYCLHQLRDRQEAEDAVQSTFLYALSSLQRGVAPRSELPWLYTIAHNVCRTQRRSLRRRRRLEAAVDVDSLAEVVGRDDPSSEELDGLGSALAALPENQRRALILREWQGLSYAEVGERLGLSESAVEAALCRARRNLTRKLRPAERAASVGALITATVRRIGSLCGGGKAAAAAVAVGIATGTAVAPLATTANRRPAVHTADAREIHVRAGPRPLPRREPAGPVVRERPRAASPTAALHAETTKRAAPSDAPAPPHLMPSAPTSAPPPPPRAAALPSEPPPAPTRRAAPEAPAPAPADVVTGEQEAPAAAAAPPSDPPPKNAVAPAGPDPQPISTDRPAPTSGVHDVLPADPTQVVQDVVPEGGPSVADAVPPLPPVPAPLPDPPDLPAVATPALPDVPLPPSPLPQSSSQGSVPLVP